MKKIGVNKLKISIVVVSVIVGIALIILAFAVNASTDTSSGIQTASLGSSSEMTSLSYDVISKVSDGFKTKLTLTSSECIKEIYIAELNQTIPNTRSAGFTTFEHEFSAQKGTTYNVKVVMSNLKEESKTFSIDSFLNSNRAPSTPTISKWPSESSIKKGRNVTITATSTDPDGDAVTYEWENRPAETTTYSIGSHTVRVRAVDIYGAASAWASVTFNVVNIEAARISYTFTEGNFNILGDGKQTTYSNSGYTTVLQVNGSNVDISGGSGSNGGVSLSTAIEPIYDGNYLQITYTVKNTTSSSKTIGIATHADIMINNNDSATITNSSGNTGFVMTDGTYNYKVILKNNEYVTNADTYWFGQYNNRTSNLWNNSNISSLTNTDSGMVFSWKNRTLPAYGTQTYSFVMGLE